MWERWRQIGLVAAGLFAVTVAARLVSRFSANDNKHMQDRISWVAFGVIAAGLSVLAFLWARRYPMLRVTFDLGGAVLIACLLSVLVGPLITGGGPFKNGAGFFFAQIWLYLGVAFGGGLLGLLIVTALGQDYRSQALKRFTQTQLAKPRRPVKR
jgi:hypothetical protein